MGSVKFRARLGEVFSLNRGERCQAENAYLHFADSGVRGIKLKSGRFPVADLTEGIEFHRIRVS